MGKFDDILLTVDYDRTLTGTDGTIPARNLEAIAWFMENGGAFTVNTGRSLPMARAFLGKVPASAPFLLYNGAAAYDEKTGKFTFLHEIGLSQKELVEDIIRAAVDLVVEVQGLDKHYAFSAQPEWAAFYETVGCAYGFAQPDADLGPLLKLSVCGPLKMETNLKSLFASRPEIDRQYDALEAYLQKRYEGALTVVRAAPNILDIQTAGASKGRSARELLLQMGRRILVCVGDHINDITMLEEADYAFIPGDSALLGRYEPVCDCSSGAVADVIYKKNPRNIRISLDKI